jgi:hypothetical protein
MKKIYLALAAFALVGFFLGGMYSISPASLSATTIEVGSAFASDGTNTMSSANLRPGDILLIGTDDTIYDYLIPGKWSHTVIFGGWAAYYGQIWGTEEGTWLSAGEPWVIHSTAFGSAQAAGRPSWDDDSGLRTSRFTTVCNAHADNIVALRILKSGGYTLSVAEENALVSFCTSKLYTGNGYDFNWFAKQVGVDTGTEPWLPPFAPDGYYCSELAWAMTMYVLGLDLDGDFSPFDIGVSPEDLYWSQYTSVIACEMNSDPNGNGINTLFGYTINCPHPYTNYYDYTWTIYAASYFKGYTRVYFSAFDTEYYYDKVYLYDGNDVLQQTLTGTLGAFWSAWIPGNVVKIRLVTDVSVVKNGFTITQYQTSDYGYDASSDLYLVTTFVDEIYYDDDYDPWPKGAGEEYFETYTGDGYFPVMEQFPYGDGKKGNGVENWWSVDGSGALDWNTWAYSLISYNAPLKVRICPGEVDDDSGDDWYPAWQGWWEPWSWHGMINAGWYWTGSRIDYGDCRYTIWYRVDAVF